MKHFSRYSWPLLLLLPSLASAAEAPATYTLLAPLSVYLTGSPNLTQYLQGVVQVMIGIAGILAVIMIVVGGIQLMGTPSASGKSAAKETIWNATFGVLLAIGAWILLYTINPLLLSNELNLTDVAPSPAANAVGTITETYPTRPGWYFKYTDETAGIYYNAAGTSAATCAALLAPATAAGKTIIEVNGQKCFEVLGVGASIPAGELSTRNALCGNNSCVGSTPIGINNPPCRDVGARGCTNVGGLGSAAVSAIQSLASACGCNIIISGGTEYWLHSQTPGSSSNHAPGNDVFDLRESVALNQLIKTGTRKSSFKNFSRWLYNGFWYTDEGDHWHACKDGTTASYCKS